ncbi:uncharacterized protein A1O5_06533 [Cladophialophora psammophila CBS 110553]|uniref:Nephrocystin 3-like N-terminal domain-containing protein n=1 Tax=Cladophialophora psammophila CBS 110553 TaxID=1182543 RepID=W9XJD2_9EURO|nr:uncharacterized protein A1O5_06533 [Cladophialophora psammophila CBS 110553]EXJ70464.1 hypothetical protein A1O5_06533 [Cladophialophora psammophila CBS 110553]
MEQEQEKLYGALDSVCISAKQRPSRFCYTDILQAGAGKTILASIVIDSLERYFEYENVAIAYIYCSYEDQDNQTATNLLASLLQQLVRKASNVSENIISVYKSHAPRQTRPSLDIFSTLLRSEARRLSKVFVVIDALDECSKNNGTRRSLVEEIRKLQPSIQLLTTWRHDAAIERESKSVTHIEVRASDQDIRRYIENRIKRADRLVLHAKNDPSLQDTIVHTISEKGKGMFLLAQLHMDRLAGKYSCRNVRRALQNLPKELDDIYDKAMHNRESLKAPGC